jgi:hypothetical protein
MAHAPNRRPDRTTYENVQGKQATAWVFYEADDHEALIEIPRDDEIWVFAVNNDPKARVLTTGSGTDNRIEKPDIPDWLRETLLGIGVEGVGQE